MNRLVVFSAGAFLALSMSAVASAAASDAGERCVRVASDSWDLAREGNDPGGGHTDDAVCPKTASTHDSSRFLDGELGMGAGASYQFDHTSTAALAVVNWTWDRDRYEIAAIRFMGSQIHDRRRPDAVIYARPAWILPFSRRWTLIREPNGGLIAGFGGTYKTKTDELNGSHLNFTEQLGWRFELPVPAVAFEVVVRHVSNAGLKKPNRGQDFITAEFVF